MPVFKSIGVEDVRRLSALYVHKSVKGNSGFSNLPVVIDTDKSWFGKNIIRNGDVEYDALKLILEYKDILRVVLNPSLQAGYSDDALFYNKPVVLQGFTLYVGSSCNTTALPPFWDIFPLDKDCDHMYTVAKDIPVIHIMGDAVSAMNAISRRGNSMVYSLGMVEGVPAITGYDGVKPGGNFRYLYKSGNAEYDIFIEKLVGFSDRFCLKYNPIELDKMYWFSNISKKEDDKVCVRFNSYTKEYSMYLSHSGLYPEMKNQPLLF